MAEAGTMIGLCGKCGKRLKYEEIPKGFATGAVMAFFSTPLFFLSFLAWPHFLLSLSVVGSAILIVWLFTRRLGGYVQVKSLAEYKKKNIGLVVCFGIAGASFSFCWLLLSLRFFS